ncbi:MAG: autotransporter-associated beta strand repeat-containing protein [Thermoguttaceae bacterium]|nr:autotransporter-associated beta strand repeat-containing protein [Thermoguttaceae bacterium]
MDFNSVKSTMNRFHNALRCGALAAIVVLSAFAFGGIAAAQQDLDGSDVIVNSSGPWDIPYTNSNVDVPSYIVVRPLNNGTRYTYSGALTGNIFVDITHQSYTNNDNRFTLSNTGNTFTNGVAMHNGILFVSNNNQLVSFSGGLTLDNAVFMAYGDCNFDVTIPEGSFGGMRASGGSIVLNQKVTGGGDLVIITENNNVVTMKGANDYAGVTSIGTIQGGNNLYAYLELGADNTLPSTTVVEIGKSQNPTYSYTNASAARLNLNGKTQTIAGLYGAGNAAVTNGAAAVSNLTINVADGKSYEYSGAISGNSATNVTNLTVTGAGNQTLAGNITNASLTKSGTGALTVSGGTVTLSSLAVTGGTFNLGSNTALTVSGKLSSNSALDLNGSNLTYTSNVATDFNNVDITNTNTEKQSTLSFVPASNLTAAQTFNKTVSGNTRIVVKLPQNQENNSRFVLSGTNDHTGGLYIEQGTVRVDNYAALGTSKQIDMKHGSLMTNQTFAGYTINLVGDASKGERGAIRLSGGNGNFDAYVTGVGSLEIVYDGAVTLTNTANDYQGKTYIGNFQWRASSSSGNTNGAATLNLGNSGVLPDTTEVVLGKNAEGNGTTGAITFDLKGFNETVAGISGQSTSATITSSTPATLTLIGNGDYSYSGKVTGSATVEKQGTGTLTISGANTGSLVVSEGTLVLTGDNSGAQSITVKGSGVLAPKSEASMATTVNLQTTAFAYADNKFTKNTKFVISESGTVISVPMTDLQSGTYFRQRFTGIDKDFQSYFTNPEPMSNMDKIANTAYLPADTATYFTEDIWGSTTGDQNNTNLLMTKVVNTTDAPITLDFAYQFHNSAYLAITDSEGNRTVVMNWATSSAHTIDGASYSFATSTGEYTFEPGETYTIEARIFRFNRTIGANGGGVNGFGGTLVGMGAKVQGTDGEYLPLNFNGENWTFSDGSFTTSSDASFVASNVTIDSGATLSFNTQNNNFDVYSTFNGEGTLIVDPNEGVTHTYADNIGGSLSLTKYGDGVLVLDHANDMSGTVSIQAGEVVYAQAGAMESVNSLTIAPNAQLTVDLPASEGAASVRGIVQNEGTVTITNGRFRTYGITGNGTIFMDDGTLMNLEHSDGSKIAETLVNNAIVIEEGKTGTFNVGWSLNNNPDSKLQLNGTLSGVGDFILETNGNAPSALSQIAPLVPNFSSSDFTGNVITNSGYNMLVMGKENAFGESVGTLQDNGWVDINGYNQTFAGLTGTGNIINRGSADATFTLNVPEGETTKYEGLVYGIANQSDGKSFQNISFVKSGEGTAQFDASAGELCVKDFTVSGGRLDVKEYLTGNVLVNGGVLSPGNSVGTLNVTGNVSVVNGKALFEFNDNSFDVLNILGEGNSFSAGDGMIELYFGAEGPDAWAVDGAEYQLVSDEGFTAGNYDSWLANYTTLFGLTGKSDGLYLVALASPEPGSGVPEPSTWALLVLGVVALLLRKRS